MTTPENKVLIVRSRGNCWGFPKGSRNDDEIPIDCAIRELKEETGVDVEKHLLTDRIKLNNVTYFLIVKDECTINIHEIRAMVDNDSSGIGWIKLECLKETLDKIPTTSHIKHFLLK